MANVIHNEDVKNEQDLQNLVVGIIFRMDKPFTPNEVEEIVNYYLKGSAFYDNTDLIYEHVSSTLDLLQDRDTLRRRNGICYMRNPINKSFPTEYYQYCY